MKFRNIILSAFFIIIQFLCCHITHAQNKTLIKSIEYDVPIFNEFSYNLNSGRAYSDWWDGNIETSKLLPFQKEVIEKASNGEIKVYDGAGNQLTLKDVNQIISRPDTLRYQRLTPPFDIYDTIVFEKIYPGDVQYLRFREQWVYDSNTFKITKQISEYSPVWVEYNQENKKTGKTIALFWIKCNKDSNKDFKPFTDLIGYNLLLNNKVNISYLNKFKTISDDTLSRKQFFSAFTNAAENGKMKIYEDYDIENFYNYDSDIILPLNKISAYLKFNLIDTLHLFKSYPPYDEYDTIIIDRLDRNNIIGLMFNESWLIDTKTLEIKKEILGFSTLIDDIYNYDEEFIGIKKLFYYSFDRPFRFFELK
jgi:hypothetical protein